MYLFKKNQHAPAFNLTQLARFPYKSERESIKLQSLYKPIYCSVRITMPSQSVCFITRLAIYDNLKKKPNYETIKDHNFQNEYQLRRPSISVVMYTFTTKKYSAREMRVCLLGILSPQCICF